MQTDFPPQGMGGLGGRSDHTHRLFLQKFLWLMKSALGKPNLLSKQQEFGPGPSWSKSVVHVGERSIASQGTGTASAQWDISRSKFSRAEMQHCISP